MTIELNEDELFFFEDVLLYAKKGLEHTIQEHYNSKIHDHYERGVIHAIGLLEEQAIKQITMIDTLLERLGRKGFKDDLFKFLEKDYEQQHGITNPK